MWSLKISPAVISLASLFLGVGICHAKSDKPNAEELLKDADRARGAVEGGLTWNIAVKTFEGSNSNEVSYIVKVKGVDALAEATAPARNKGEMMLFNDRNLWFFKPGLKKPVAISARQKLMGQAANGDIASTNYYRDYDGTVTGEETIDGKACFKLDLKAKAKNVTYDGIRYWISKDNHLGVKAEFLTVSGEIFKVATFTYNNKVKIGGKSLPFISKVDIQDSIKKDQHTEILYQNPNPESHPDSIFNINNLLR